MIDYGRECVCVFINNISITNKIHTSFRIIMYKLYNFYNVGFLSCLVLFFTLSLLYLLLSERSTGCCCCSFGCLILISLSPNNELLYNNVI